MKVNEWAGIGNHYTAKFWEYDPRTGRRDNPDPHPTVGISPYAAYGNNPIWRQDVLGNTDKPKVIGTTSAVVKELTDEQITSQLDAHKISGKTNLSNAYLVNLVSQEKVSLTLYDKDGNKKYGGVTTIGIGHTVHSGAIGSDQYDKQAIEKEKPYSAGETVDKAFEEFGTDLETRTKDVNGFMKAAGVSSVDANVFSVFTDVYFNAGTTATENAISLYKTNGKAGVIAGLKSNAILSPSTDRKNFRIGLLQDVQAAAATNATQTPAATAVPANDQAPATATPANATPSTPSTPPASTPSSPN